MNHHTARDGFTGYDFKTDKDGVWFEGTGPAAIAYLEAEMRDFAESIQSEI